MADTSQPKDRRSPPQHPVRGEPSPPAAPAAEWGATPPKSGVRGEVKLALLLVMTLAGAFGYIVYRKFDALQQVAAAEAVDALKFKPLEAPGSTPGKEVDLSAPPEQPSEPLFDESARTTTSDPFALSATTPPPASIGILETPRPGNSGPEEPRQLNIQTATLVTAVEDRSRGPATESAPWSPAPEAARDVPLDLFQPEPSPSQPAATTTSPPAFPQEFPQSPPAQAEPLIAAAREPDFASATPRPTPADVPFEPSFLEPASPAPETPAAIAIPQPVVSSATLPSRTDEPLPFATLPREAPPAAVGSFSPAVAPTEPTASLLWTPVETTPAATPSPTIESTTSFSPVATSPVVERSAPPEFPGAQTSEAPRPAVQSLTSALSTNSPAWSPEPARGDRFPTAPAATAGEQVYTIRPGDNYWSISRNLYGTPRYFDALTEYNRERIPDPSRMQPGSQLVAPPREVLEARYPQLCGIATAAVKPSVAAPALPVAERGQFTVGPGGQPLYRVGQGDTLTSIAQKHLGRASRWTQVYEMNLDVLPNADTLKPGTVLKLPQDASQVAVTPDAPSSR